MRLWFVISVNKTFEPRGSHRCVFFTLCCWFVLIYFYKTPNRVFTSFLVGKRSDVDKQAGTGPSRRHIQGLKIAKRLPSVKYSFTVLENRNFLKKNFLKNYVLKKLDRMARRGSLARAPGALTSHNAEKLKGGTL